MWGFRWKIDRFTYGMCDGTVILAVKIKKIDGVMIKRDRWVSLYLLDITVLWEIRICIGIDILMCFTVLPNLVKFDNQNR